MCNRLTQSNHHCTQRSRRTAQEPQPHSQHIEQCAVSGGVQCQDAALSLSCSEDSDIGDMGSQARCCLVGRGEQHCWGETGGETECCSGIGSGVQCCGVEVGNTGNAAGVIEAMGCIALGDLGTEQ